MVLISVPALYDGNNAYLSGKLVGIYTSAIVVGVEPKPAFPSIPGYAATLVNTLRVADTEKGTFYLDLTLAQYDAIVSAALQDINKEITTKFTIGASPATTITDTRLYNVTINAIFIDNVPIDISTVTYTPLTDSTLTFPITLPPASVVQVVYNKN